jgi:carboxyl-terminal processing protease
LNERAYLASRIYASVLTYFAHWQDVPDLDVETAYRKYLDKALANGDRFAFSRASMEFLAAFHNGHTMFVDKTLIQQGETLPFAAQFIEGKWVVTWSCSAGLKLGEIIESIDGQPFEQFFLACRPLISASTDHWARRALFMRMPLFSPYAHLLPERFVLGLSDGRQVAIDRRTALKPPFAETEGRWLEAGKVAYIRIPSFFTPQFEKRALELVREFHGAAALIVDVRGNMGGNTPRELTSLLMDRPYRWWTESTPLTLPFFRYLASLGESQYKPLDHPEFLWHSSVEQPAKDGYKGKLALLVDAGCLSSCEDFVLPFKSNGRAFNVGETTGGSTGQPYFLDLGSEMLLMVGSKREMFPDGSRFEGVGIKPDLEIAPSVEDVRQERDVVLEAARKRLAPEVQHLKE